ncbi:ATP-grasp fold amidoligase family protein [Amaricoccus sp.]|uniref:ATP-grasp fold amidoligase family protein n=1 Tax=Amaricoccus sp. TaxID=1872485 RepID=UPI001B58E34D|nr:ATP-grasp fold amidoligase family protein [Amaricoccus sp.]MBP7002527.1 hypothetical protein [Amaricoccus sp.]
MARSLKERLKRYLYPDYLMARRQYRQRNGFYPDLLSPRDLSEKVLWLKLHDRSRLHTLCADKILVRDYVAARAGSEFLVPTLLVTYDPSEVTAQAIRQDRFVVKTNHDQGGVFICRDRESFDWEDMRAKIRKRAKTNKYYEFRERQYKDIRPGILVERFLEGERGQDVLEIKINCFHGEPRFVQAIVGRFSERRHANLDPDWRRMSFHGRSPEIEHDLPRPRALERMLAAAARLSEPFLFCRVDFLLDTSGRPWFSEITFHPAAGLVRYNPPEMERALGDMIDLSRIDESRRAQRAAWDESRRLDLGRTWARLQDAR